MASLAHCVDLHKASFSKEEKIALRSESRNLAIKKKIKPKEAMVLVVRSRLTEAQAEYDKIEAVIREHFKAPGEKVVAEGKVVKAEKRARRPIIEATDKEVIYGILKKAKKSGLENDKGAWRLANVIADMEGAKISGVHMAEAVQYFATEGDSTKGWIDNEVDALKVAVSLEKNDKASRLRAAKILKKLVPTEKPRTIEKKAATKQPWETSDLANKPNIPASYVQAKKQPDGKYKLFFTGTTSEVFDGKTFASAPEARQFFKVQQVKAKAAAKPENIEKISDKNKAIELAKSIIKKRTRATTKDTNKLLALADKRGISREALFIGDDPATREIATDHVATINLEKGEDVSALKTELSKLEKEQVKLARDAAKEVPGRVGVARKAQRANRLAWNNNKIKQLKELIEKSEAIKRGKVKFSVAAPMYSALTRAAEAPKFPANIPAKSVINQLRRATGVKQVEIDVSGLAEWLEGKDRVLKSDVVDFLRMTEIRIEEVEKGEILSHERLGWMKRGNIYKPSSEFEVGIIEYLPSSDKYVYKDLEGTRDTYDTLNEAKNAALCAAKNMGIRDTKFAEHVLSGGEPGTYRELVLTVPVNLNAENAARSERVRELIERKAELGRELGITSDHDTEVDLQRQIGNTERQIDMVMKEADVVAARTGYISPHWNEPNVIAHIRGDTRTVDGKKVFHVAEFQSDIYSRIVELEQAEGKQWEIYSKKTGEMVDRLSMEESTEEHVAADILSGENKHFGLRSVPSPELANLKKLFPWGEMWHELVAKKALEYAVKNDLDGISWDTAKTQVDRWESALRRSVDEISWTKAPNNMVWVSAEKNKESAFRNMVPLQGETTINDQRVTLNNLIGKELATKIRESSENEGTFEGKDLTLGGEFYKIIYDQKIPGFLKKYGKKWGAKVGEGGTQVKEGGWGPVRRYSEGLITKTEMEEALEKLKTSRMFIHTMPITDAMREAIQTAGQPLFAEGKTPGKRLTVDTAKAEIANKIGLGPLDAMIRARKIQFVTSSEATEIIGYARESKDQGFFKDGVVYLIPENIKEGKAFAVLLHELGVHLGYNKIFGEKLAREVFASFVANNGKMTPLGKAVSRAMHRVPHRTRPDLINEEAVAYFCEEHANIVLPLHRKIIARMRLWAVKYFNVKPDIFVMEDYVALAAGAMRGEIKEARRAPTVESVSREVFYSQEEQEEINKFSVPEMPVEDAKKQVTNSKAFKGWFGDSKVVDEDGEPLIIYHGTTHDIKIFDKEKSNIADHLGAGFYFTDSENDAEQNYAGEGPDLTNRIDLLAERIGDAYDIEEMADLLGVELGMVEAVQGNHEGSRQLASEHLMGGHPNVMEVYLNISNPFVMEPDSGTRLEIIRDEEYYRDMARDEIDKEDFTDEEGELDGDSYDEAITDKADEFYYEDYDPQETGNGVALKGGIIAAGDELGRDGGQVWRELMERLGMLEGQTAQEVFDALTGLDSIAYMESDTGELMGNEFIRLAIEGAGYDGIMMDAEYANKKWRMDVPADTMHYVAFEPTQIKSIFNIGTFDPTNADIRYSVAEQKDLRSWADDLIKSAKDKGHVMDKETPSPERLRETSHAILGGLDLKKLNRPARSFLQGLSPKGKGIGQAIEKWLASPEWYQHPVLKKITGRALDKSEKFHTLFNEFNAVDDPMAEHDTVAKTLEALARKGEISKAAFILGKTSADFKKLETLLDDADVYSEEHTVESLKEKGYTEDVVQAWSVVRESYDKQLDALLKPMKDLVARIKEQAAFMGTEPIYPDFGDFIIEGKKRRLTLQEAVMEMGRYKGTYSPRIRDRGSMVITGVKKKSIAEGGDEWVRYNRKTTSFANLLRDKLKDEGFENIKVEKEHRLPEETFQAVRMAEMGTMIGHAAAKGLDKYDGDMQMTFMDEVISASADLIKSRGARATMIRRREGLAVRGYITDPLKRFVRYTGTTSAGIAKAEMAQRMIKDLYGTYENGKKVGGIDSAKEGEIHSLGRAYIEEQLRNAETGDRIVGVMKGLTTLKFLGFNPRSVLVNMTALTTSVPMALHTYVMDGKGGLLRIGKVLSGGCKDYTKVMAGKRLSNVEEQDFIDGFKDAGYTDAQYTRDAMGNVQGAYGTAWSKLMGGSMWVFGKSEEWVRGGTALAAFRLCKKQGLSNIAAREKAIFATAKAHGTYGKETLPMVAWGKGVGRLGQAFYTYMKFPHNYLQMLYDAGIRKKNIKGVIFGIAAPAVLGGVAAVPMYATVMAIANAMMSLIGDDRDAEKLVYDTINEYVGKTGEEAIRGGVLGLLDLDISGSLSMGPGAIPRSLFDLTGAVGGMAEDVYKGVGHIVGGEPGRAAEKLLPKAIGNIFTAIREIKGATTSRGNRIWNDQGLPYVPEVSETAKRMAGFRSARRAILAQSTWVSKREERRFKETSGTIYKKIRFLTGRSENIIMNNDVRDKISEYNKNALETTNIPLITPASIERQIERMKTPTTKQKARVSMSERVYTFEGSIWASALGIVENPDNTQAEIKRLSDTGVLKYSAPPSRNINAGYGIKVKLDDDQFSRYVADTSAIIKEATDRLMSQIRWEAWSDKKKAFAVKMVQNKGREIVRNRLKITILKAEIKKRGK